MNKVVITGASGFLGSNLIKKLENNEDVMVYALSSKEIESKDTNIKSLHKDVIDSEDAEPIFKDAIVVNCAFPRNSTGTGMADGLAYINRLFMACRRYKAKAIINISSQSVYSQKREFPADEDTEICLESPYAVGKYATELMLKSICDGTDIKYTNLRMASLIGPGFDQRIVNRLVKKAIAREDLCIKKNAQVFGFLDIEDATEGICYVVRNTDGAWRNSYNMGVRGGYTLEEIADKIVLFMAQMGINIKIAFEEGNECSNSTLNINHCVNDFQYCPRVELEESIERIYDALLLE